MFSNTISVTEFTTPFNKQIAGKNSLTTIQMLFINKEQPFLITGQKDNILREVPSQRDFAMLPGLERFMYLLKDSLKGEESKRSPAVHQKYV